MKRARLPKMRHRKARRNWMCAPAHFGQILMNRHLRHSRYRFNALAKGLRTNPRETP